MEGFEMGLKALLGYTDQMQLVIRHESSEALQELPTYSLKFDLSKQDCTFGHLRPYDRENPASRSICEVKHVPAKSVLRSGRAGEAGGR